MGAAVTGWGCAVPNKRLTNEELSQRIGLDEDWILERTGVKERRIAAEGQSTSSLAAQAGVRALEEAGLSGQDLDYIIVATVTGDYKFPATASLVQSALGAERAAAYDLGAGCSGFLYALAQAGSLIDSGAARRVLVCGADILSRITDYSDPRTCVLFGDGAGAVVVERFEGPSRIGPFVLRSDGSRPELLWIPPDDRYLRMQGREVYRHAVDGMARTVADVLRASGAKQEEVDLLVAHQANGRILAAVADRLGFSSDRVASNIDRYGNTSSASIPIALCEAVEAGTIGDGSVLVLAAFGAGFAWGAGVLVWGKPPANGGVTGGDAGA
ncbi:MAG TPA: beta-ketoacyl-ACP synthase III [Actinomycetota bacterium]|jgi:3-oxoacyl-[acyl-carrier-protein] synthase-3|nr:beta-ketoacyl-ACP synthase III [Actinomycetota bacterium]